MNLKIVNKNIVMYCYAVNKILTLSSAQDPPVKDNYKLIQDVND